MRSSLSPNNDVDFPLVFLLVHPLENFSSRFHRWIVLPRTSTSTFHAPWAQPTASSSLSRRDLSTRWELFLPFSSRRNFIDDQVNGIASAECNLARTRRANSSSLNIRVDDDAILYARQLSSRPAATSEMLHASCGARKDASGILERTTVNYVDIGLPRSLTERRHEYPPRGGSTKSYEKPLEMTTTIAFAQ